VQRTFIGSKVTAGLDLNIVTQNLDAAGSTVPCYAIGKTVKVPAAKAGSVLKALLDRGASERRALR
jgi:hypothetical protein